VRLVGSLERRPVADDRVPLVGDRLADDRDVGAARGGSARTVVPHMVGIPAQSLSVLSVIR